MHGYLYQLFHGFFNVSEKIKVDTEEFKAALQKLIETQKKLKSGLSTEQLSMLEEMQAQKDLTVAFETYEAFLVGAKLAVGIWEELKK